MKYAKGGESICFSSLNTTWLSELSNSIFLSYTGRPTAPFVPIFETVHCLTWVTLIKWTAPLTDVILCVCARFHGLDMFVRVYSYMCVHTSEGPDWSKVSSLTMLHLIYWSKVYPWPLSSPVQLLCRPVSSRVFLSSPVIHWDYGWAITSTWHLYRFWLSELWFSCLISECLTHWVISPAISQIHRGQNGWSFYVCFLLTQASSEESRL